MPIPDQDQINTYASTPDRVIGAIAGLSEEQFHNTPSTDEWSIHDVIIHLADSETFGFERLRKAIAEDNPSLQVYDEAAWAKNLSYHSQDRELALALFTAQRRSTTALLQQLAPELWERTATHPERGAMTLYAIFQLYLEHGNVHVAQIERLKGSL